MKGGAPDSPANAVLGGGLQGGGVAEQAAGQDEVALVLEHAVHRVLQLHQVVRANRVGRRQPARRPEVGPCSLRKHLEKSPHCDC